MGYWNLSGGHLDRVESITDGSRLVILKSFNYLKMDIIIPVVQMEERNLRKMKLFVYDFSAKR